MTKSKKVLIAVDGSPHSLYAVGYVARNCAQADVVANLMYVMPTAPETFWDLEKDSYFKRQMRAKYAQWKRNETKAAQAFLDGARDLLVKAKFRANKVGVILQEREVGIARDIIAESSKGYDAVVVGRRGLSKLEDIFLGSVSNKIVQGIENVPVWVVGGDIESKKMLLAVDSSENSRKAVSYVGRFAAGTESELTLFHVVRRVGIGLAHGLAVSDEEMEEIFLYERKNEIPRMFRSYMEILQEAGVAPERVATKAVLHSATRAGDILKEAKEIGYGTIVMGRRGLSRVREFLLGRVTKKVLERAEGFAVWLVP